MTVHCQELPDSPVGLCMTATSVSPPPNSSSTILCLRREERSSSLLLRCQPCFLPLWNNSDAPRSQGSAPTPGLLSSYRRLVLTPSCAERGSSPAACMTVHCQELPDSPEGLCRTATSVEPQNGTTFGIASDCIDPVMRGDIASLAHCIITKMRAHCQELPDSPEGFAGPQRQSHHQTALLSSYHRLVSIPSCTET